MALSIGELVGYVSIDEKGVEQGISRADAAIRGFAGNAGSALSGLDGRMRQEGERAGKALGDGLTDGAGQGAERAGTEVESRMSGMGGKVKAVAVGAGAVAGAGLGYAMAQSLDVSQSQAKLAAQLGGSAKYAGEVGQMAGDLYSQNYGSGLEDVNQALVTVMQSGALAEDSTNADIESMTGKVMSLSSAFGQDLTGSVNAVAQMVRTGLAKDSNQALDILTRGFQQGNDKAGDMLDTMNEYGTQFRKLGVDGTMAMGLISQGLKGGARDADIVADSIKEFSIRAIDGSKTTSDGFKAIGLDAGKMSAEIAKGGPTANAALGQVLDRLRAMKDPAAQSAAAVALFGTQAEDMGKALFALDPSTAVDAMGNVEGAAAKMDAKLSDTAQSKVAGVQRSFEMWTASLIGTQGPIGDIGAAAMAFGTPALSMAGSVGMVALSFGKLVAPIAGAIASGAAWAAQTVAQGARAVASMVVTGAQYAGQFAMMAARGAVSVAVLIGQMIAWAAGIVAQGAVALASLAVTAAGYVAQWVVMAAGAMARAAIMAASWFIALGPVGWVIALVIGLVALIIANWDTVVQWTQQAWAAVSGAVSAAWQAVTGAVSSAVAAVVGWLSSAWSNVTSMAQNAWSGLVSIISSAVGNVLGFVAALPGRILASLGFLGSLLWNAGMDIVSGLWNGIVSMGGWLMSKITGWIRDVVPGPILSFLGIASPSRFMHEEVGRWIPEGLAGGIIANAATAADAARALAADTASGAVAGAQGAMSGVSLNLGATPADLGGYSTGPRRPGDSTAPSVTVNVHNPLPETTSDSINRRARTLATLGAF